MDFKEQYKQYEIKINELKSQYATAEKQAIVAETNLINLRNNKEHLIEECLQLGFMARYLERTADHLTNIAENIIYIQSIIT